MTTLSQFYNRFLLVLDLKDMRDVRSQENATVELNAGLGGAEEHDFMVQHLGASFKKISLY